MPSYWACVPVYVEIDYSYLRKGEWIGEMRLIDVGIDPKKDVSLPKVELEKWGLVNCIN